MLKQYNFKIPEALEIKVKKALEDSGLEGKSDFLEDMVTVYSAYLIEREEDMHEGIAAYKHISKESKDVLSKTFSHLLSTIDYNFSSTLHEKIELDKERKRLLERSTLLDQELDRMKIVYLEERKEVEERFKEELKGLQQENERLLKALEGERTLLAKSKEEVNSLSLIAEQTSLVLEENKKLRSSLSSLGKEHRSEIDILSSLHEKQLGELRDREAKKLSLLEKKVEDLNILVLEKDKKIFELSHLLERSKEDLTASTLALQNSLEEFQVKEKNYKNEFEKISTQLIEVNSLYNQLLGKIEVLEALKNKK